MATLTGPSGGYFSNGWYTSTNAWGSSSLTYGTDYTINGTYDPTNITKGVSYTWNFGSLPSNGDYNVLAYPEICYGQDAWDTSIDPAEAPFPLKVADITKFNASYNVSWGGQTQGYDVAFDMFLSSNPTGGSAAIDNEVMVWIHTGGFNPGTPIASFNDNGVAGSLYTFWASGQGWQYSAFLTNSDMPSGTIDVAAILKQLVSRGIVKSTDYVENIDIGAEVAAGSGTLTVNNVGYDIQTTGSAETIIGTPNATTTTPPPVTPPPVTPPPTTTPTATTAIRFLEPDFNKDGKADILFQNASDGTIKLWTMSGTTELAYNLLGNGTTAVKLICAADFNGDGAQDILFQSTSGQPTVWLMNGNNVVSTASLGANPGTSWKIVSVGDFNGDFKADILLMNSSTHQAMVDLVNGTSVTSSVNIGTPGKTWSVIGSGDFNGNGKSDVLWQNSNGQIQVWTMNGTSVTSKTTISTNPGSSWHAIGSGDFNGDGKSDILFQNSSGQVRIWEMNGTSVLLDKTISTNPGSAWTAIGAEDFNNDGKDDVLFQNSSTGQVMVWAMNGTSIASQGIVGNPDLGWHAAVGG